MKVYIVMYDEDDIMWAVYISREEAEREQLRCGEGFRIDERLVYG